MKHDDREGHVVVTRATARVAPTIQRYGFFGSFAYGRGDPRGRPGNHSPTLFYVPKLLTLISSATYTAFAVTSFYV